MPIVSCTPSERELSLVPTPSGHDTRNGWRYFLGISARRAESADPASHFRGESFIRAKGLDRFTSDIAGVDVQLACGR